MTERIRKPIKGKQPYQKKPDFDSYNANAPIQSALGSAREQSRKETATTKSTNYRKFVPESGMVADQIEGRGWAIHPTYIELYDVEGYVTSGVYTPTPSDSTNLDTVEVNQCQYMRVKDVVTVSGSFVATPTIADSTEFFMSLPFQASLGSSYLLAGVGFSSEATDPVQISADGGGAGRAKMNWEASSTSDCTWSFTFTYYIARDVV